MDLSPIPYSSEATSNIDAQAKSLDDLKASSTIRNSYTSVITGELEELLLDLQTLSSLQAKPSQTMAQRQQVCHIIYEAECKLIRLNQSQTAGFLGLSSTEMTLSKSYQLAVQIFSMVVLRNIKIRSPLVQRYVHALRSDVLYRKSLVEDKSSTSNRAWSVLLLWIETVLSIATMDPEKKLESVSVLRSLLWHLGSTEQNDFMGNLKEVCWLDGCFDDQIFDMWSMIKS